MKPPRQFRGDKMVFIFSLNFPQVTPPRQRETVNERVLRSPNHGCSRAEVKWHQADAQHSLPSLSRVWRASFSLMVVPPLLRCCWRWCVMVSPISDPVFSVDSLVFFSLFFLVRGLRTGYDTYPPPLPTRTNGRPPHARTHARTDTHKVEMPFETPRVQVEQMASIRNSLAARGLPGGPLVSSRLEIRDCKSFLFPYPPPPPWKNLSCGPKRLL